MTLSNKDALFNLRLDDETREKLEQLAELEQRSMAAQIRYLIIREWEAQLMPISQLPQVAE